MAADGPDIVITSSRDVSTDYSRECLNVSLSKQPRDKKEWSFETDYNLFWGNNEETGENNVIKYITSNDIYR